MRLVLTAPRDRVSLPHTAVLSTVVLLKLDGKIKDFKGLGIQPVTPWEFLEF